MQIGEILSMDSNYCCNTLRVNLKTLLSVKRGKAQKVIIKP